MISFAVTAKLICVFVFANAKCLFSHDAAQMMKCITNKGTLEGFVIFPHILRYDLHVRGLSKKFVEFVNKNKTTIPITFKFVYN